MAGRIPADDSPKSYHRSYREGIVSGAKQNVKYTATFDRAPLGFFERISAIFSYIFRGSFVVSQSVTYEHEFRTDIVDLDRALIAKVKAAYAEAQGITLTSKEITTNAIDRGDLKAIEVKKEEVDAFMNAIDASKKLKSLYTPNDLVFIRSTVAPRLIQVEKFLDAKRLLDPTKSHEMTSKTDQYLLEIDHLASTLKDPSYLKSPREFGSLVDREKRHFRYKVKVFPDGSKILSIPTIREAGGFKNFTLAIYKNERYEVVGKLSEKSAPPLGEITLRDEVAMSKAYSGAEVVKKEVLKIGKSSALVLECKPLSDYLAPATIKLSSIDEVKTDLRAKCTVLCDAILNLKKMHDENKVHCDIKPENILMAQSRDDKAPPKGVLWDFGLSSDLGTENAGGTPGYYLEGVTTVSKERDYYALGKTIDEIITGSYTSSDPLKKALFEEGIKRKVKPIIDDLVRTKNITARFRKIEQYDSSHVNLDDIKSRLQAALSDASVQEEIDAAERDHLVNILRLSNPRASNFITSGLKDQVGQLFNERIFNASEVSSIRTLSAMSEKMVESLRQIHFESLPEDVKDLVASSLNTRFLEFSSAFDWDAKKTELKNVATLDELQSNINRFKTEIRFDDMIDSVKIAVELKLDQAKQEFIQRNIIDEIASSDLDNLTIPDLAAKKEVLTRAKSLINDPALTSELNHFIREVDGVVGKKQMIEQFQNESLDPIERLKIAEEISRDIRFNPEIKADVRGFIREFQTACIDIDQPRFRGLFRERRKIAPAEISALKAAEPKTFEASLETKILQDILPYRRDANLIKKYLEPDPIKYVVVSNRTAFVQKRDGTQAIIKW